jgi:hypothetical protein
MPMRSDLRRKRPPKSLSAQTRKTKDKLGDHGMGRGNYLGGSTIVSNGFGFTPLLDDGGYKPSREELPTENRKKALARHVKTKKRLKGVKGKPVRK